MNLDKKLFLVVCCLFFTIYVFTSDGHRSTSDEDFLQQQALRIVLQEPDPEFVLGESTNQFKHPEFIYPHGLGPKCTIGVLCYPVGIIHSTTAVPFVFINHHLNLITTESVLFTAEDFPDPHYVFWRNSMEPDLTFMELFYSPFFSSLSVATFYLISRSFNYKITTSITLVLILGLSTIFFSYAQTSFNNAPSVFFVLLGFLFFKRFMVNQKILYSTLSGIALVFGFMIRADVIYVIIALFFFLVLSVIFQKTWTLSAVIQKIKKIISFSIPIFLGYQLEKVIETMRYAVEPASNFSSDAAGLIFYFGAPNFPDMHATIGILFSPGAGLFIYIPILLTVFFTFPDFFRKNKAYTFLFLGLSTIFILDFAGGNYWQGFTAWSPKYLYIIIPFLLLPLGASIEKRGKKILPIICILGCIGFFFNFVNIIQDVGWFVWGHPGGLITGLMSLALDTGRSCDLYICPEVTWTFQYSPLINSINLAVNNLYTDVFLLKVLGLQYYLLLLISILSIQFYLLYRMVKSNVIATVQNKKKYF